MRLKDIPTNLRKARTEALKYTGIKLKEKKCSKNVKRYALLELDLEICLRIYELMHPTQNWC